MSDDTPVNDDETPLRDDETPVNAEDTPVSESASGAPAAESETPAGESDAPAAESDAPAGESDAPAAESDAPAAESEPPPRPPGPPTEPVFTVLGVEPLEHSVSPGLRFHLHVTEPEGRDIYTIALAAQIHIDPARRTYDAAARDRLFEMFGEPERWGATTHSFMWARVEVLVPSFVGSAAFTLDVPCSYDLEVASVKYFDGLEDGEVPLTFFFNGTVLYAGENDRMQIVLVPWSCSASWRMPVDAWKRSIAAHYPKGGWIRLHEDTLDLLGRRKVKEGVHTFDDLLRELLREEERVAHGRLNDGPVSDVAADTEPSIHDLMKDALRKHE